MERLIFDSHAHYDDEAFDQDRGEILRNLPAQGICRIVNVGADLQGCRDAVALAAAYPYIYAGVGIHPECVNDTPDEALNEVETLLDAPKVVAVGEIGLDYHFEDNAPREVQREWFAKQLALANRRGFPVIVHDRDAHGDTMELLCKYRPKGVVHCFSGSVEMMREVVRLGMYIGLGGAVTFKNARVPVEVAAAVPLDHLLLETDAPYMAPVPYRGKRCDSSMIAKTAERIAEIRQLPVEELLKATQQNASRLFGIPLEEASV
ncbi:TatD family hydrolase [Anaeromassilibacillus sp. D41t1_190614_C2]|uniref:TatD family hydrolase n=1 Tax=Anaeromassilibacillus sp. D41t1_190614_C2 TaxID=2787078 RepID=UPI001749F176|nr:TatD family hydrolase [Anaeromassilibacillus sp. D41t1_190614_C2]